MSDKKETAILFTQYPEGRISQREISEEELEIFFINDGHDEWNQIHGKLPAPVWEQLFQDGTLIYEGYTLDHKAFGAGKAFDQNGAICLEGIFGIKGLLCGRAYYPNGIIRFEGTFRLNQAYGLNSPELGTWYNENGKVLYRGKFKDTRRSVGWPRIYEPEGFGSVLSSPLLKKHTLLWEDARRLVKEGIADNEADK